MLTSIIQQMREAIDLAVNGAMRKLESQYSDPLDAACQAGANAILEGAKDELNEWLDTTPDEVQVFSMVTDIADLATTAETEGVARDDLLDSLIGIARQIRERKLAA